MIFPNIKVQPYWLKTLEAAADAPVVLPEPDAYLYTSGNHRGVSLEWRGQSDMAEGTERHALYTELQVRALLGGVFAPAAQGMNAQTFNDTQQKGSGVSMTKSQKSS